MVRDILKEDVIFLERSFGMIEKRLWNLIFNFPYRKLTLLLFFMIFSYFIFSNPEVQNFVTSLEELEYLGIFIAGMLFTFGFTTPFAIGFFVVLNPSNPLLVAVLGGLGAVMGDLAIFSLIRFSFMDEFERLERTKLISGINNEITRYIGKKFRLYLLYALAGLIIASPLPDEVGVTMLAGLSKIKPGVMIIISFIFNSFGIFVMALI